MGEIKKFWTSIPAEQQKSLFRVKLEDVRTRARSLDAQSNQDSGKTLIEFTYAVNHSLAIQLGLPSLCLASCMPQSQSCQSKSPYLALAVTNTANSDRGIKERPTVHTFMCAEGLT